MRTKTGIVASIETVSATMIAVIGQIRCEFSRGVRVARTPHLVVDDGAFTAVIRIDIGNKPVNRFKLRFGIGALPAHMHYFDANRIRIHTVIGNALRRSFSGSPFVVASIFWHAILAVVTCVAIAGMLT